MFLTFGISKKAFLNAPLLWKQTASSIYFFKKVINHTYSLELKRPRKHKKQEVLALSLICPPHPDLQSCLLSLGWWLTFGTLGATPANIDMRSRASALIREQSAQRKRVPILTCRHLPRSFSSYELFRMAVFEFNNFYTGSFRIFAILNNATMDILVHKPLSVYKCFSANWIHRGESVRSQSLQINIFYTSKLSSIN